MIVFTPTVRKKYPLDVNVVTPEPKRLVRTGGTLMPEVTEGLRSVRMTSWASPVPAGMPTSAGMGHANVGRPVGGDQNDGLAVTTSGEVYVGDASDNVSITACGMLQVNSGNDVSGSCEYIL